MSSLKALYPDLITLKVAKIDQVPRVQSPPPPVSGEVNAPPIPECLDLKDVFYDREDKADLVYRIAGNTNPALLSAGLASGSKLGLSFAPNASGEAVIALATADGAGQETVAELRVFLGDPERDNLALGKPVKASSVESGDYRADFVNDGDASTRWSTEYADDQWLYIDLGKEDRRLHSIARAKAESADQPASEKPTEEDLLPERHVDRFPQPRNEERRNAP